MTSKTGAERYLKNRLKDPEYRSTYKDARKVISSIDELIRALDEKRERLSLSKAALAEEAGLQSAAIRRLFSAESPNPTISTVFAIADALDMEIELKTGDAQAV